MAKRRRSGSLARFLGGAFAIGLCVTVGVAALAIGQVSTIAADIGLHAVGSKYLKKVPPSGAQTILVIGDDHSGPYDAQCGCHLLHADTFMLVHLDPHDGQTSIMSIPRDLLVSFTWDGVPYPDQKFNSAYALGATPTSGNDQLTLKVAGALLPGVAINHYIDINFDAFIGVVRAIGCVYVDVDHRYLNNDDPSYQPINLQPGYQKLCAEQALSYVRYRHDDSDFVRVARQADFVRQAKEQLGLFDLAFKLDSIAKAFGEAIKTDISGVRTVTDLLALVAFSQSKPIRDVPFQYSNADFQVVTPDGIPEDYVTSTPQLIARSTHDFLDENPIAAPPPATSSSPAQHRHHSATQPQPVEAQKLAALDLYALPTGPTGVLAQAITLSPDVPFPIYLPTVQTGPSMPNDFHPYTVVDEQGHTHSGYRIDWYTGTAGEYYGIEGMSWTDPPLFANPSFTDRIGGRTYVFIDDGAHYHDIGWRVGNVLYWVSNTLNENLSDGQMLALAESAHPITPG
jgi:polyisoprenyl-teichoic acid--peptidoglycan teichoic acid transferase